MIFTERRPNLAESFIPILGPAWESYADFQEGKIASGLLNASMAAADALPVGLAVKGARVTALAYKALRKPMTDGAVRTAYRKAMRIVGPDIQVHHTLPLKGQRAGPDFRNNPIFLKPLPTPIHQRLHKPAKSGGYDPLRQVWYGTTKWQKAAPVSLTGRVTNTAQSAAGQGPNGAPLKPRGR